ncbi:MAG: response regulator transcription factor [Desulfobacterales bacterium]|nr:response regulator transcription factor [Desulfobacterales bacterium]MCP4161148.1 response regulator transcription factor [Deltaproteobacteria bacterium]
MNKYNILMIEDDQRLSQLTREYLERHDCIVTIADDGTTGLDKAIKNDFDLVLLDIMLPGKDGISVCMELRRQSDVPVIMLTARGEEADRVLGLELGADDYVSKPFSTRELLARIKSLVRRAKGQVGPEKKLITSGALKLDPSNGKVLKEDVEVELTFHEFTILYLLVDNKGRIMSRDNIMDAVKTTGEYSFDRSIDVHISRLRKKLGDKSGKPQMIKTVRGAGYMFID